ncbi:MAG: hypothetical protein QM754_00520 [Tepidisphaeraceae bacterium]
MDYTPSSRRLSEISHLFLSDVRQKQTGPEHRPVRTPPGAFKGDVSIDLTPEEFAEVMNAKAATPADTLADDAEAAFKPLRAVVAHHLGESMTERVRDLAMSLSNGEPVGIIYAGASGVRVCFVDPAALDCHTEEPAPEPLNNQALREAIIELDQDVCQWLLVLPEHRSPDSHALLRDIRNWTLLTAADHDGIVAAYRRSKACTSTPARSSRSRSSGRRTRRRSKRASKSSPASANSSSSARPVSARRCWTRRTTTKSA